MEQVVQSWEVNGYVFKQIRIRRGGDVPESYVYGFELADGTKCDEYYNSLDMALISAVGRKWTGKRGAWGSGVDTAAGWFARMIGMHTDIG